MSVKIYNIGLVPSLYENHLRLCEFSDHFIRHAEKPEYQIETNTTLSNIGSRPHVTFLQFSVPSEIELGDLWNKIEEVLYDDFRSGIDIPLKGTRCKKDGRKVWAQIQVDRSAEIFWELQSKIILIVSDHFKHLGSDFQELTKKGMDYDPHLTYFYGEYLQLTRAMDARGVTVLDNFMELEFQVPEPQMEMNGFLTLAESGPAFQMLDPLYHIRPKLRNSYR